MTTGDSDQTTAELILTLAKETILRKLAVTITRNANQGYFFLVSFEFSTKLYTCLLKYFIFISKKVYATATSIIKIRYKNIKIMFPTYSLLHKTQKRLRTALDIST